MRDILASELFLQSCSLLFPIPFLPVLKYFYPLVLKNAEITGKITFSSRVKEYPTIFYEDDGLLFCKFCFHSLDLKSSTIKDHLQTKSHKNKREVQETTSAPVLRQLTLTTVQKSQESRSKFVT